MDTDVLVIIAGMFYKLLHLYGEIEIWLAFGVGRNFTHHHHVNSICSNMKVKRAVALPAYLCI